jgi:DNA-directed RNA polymerase specialized sigma subunit
LYTKGVKGGDTLPLKYDQVENLLYCYKEICAVIENLKISLAQNDSDSAICSMITGNKSPKGMPFPSKGNISDSTSRIASDYAKQIESEKTAIKYELAFYQGIIDRLDAGIDALSVRNQYIIERFYYDKWTWQEIARGLRLVKRTCQLERKRAVEKLTRLLVITQQEYTRFEAFFKDSIAENRGKLYETYNRY